MMNVGDRVKVNDPEWRDAAGNSYGPGKNHGKRGVIEEDLVCLEGNDHLFMVRFDDGSAYPHWASELVAQIRERE